VLDIIPEADIKTENVTRNSPPRCGSDARSKKYVNAFLIAVVARSHAKTTVRRSPNIAAGIIKNILNCHGFIGLIIIK